MKNIVLDAYILNNREHVHEYLQEKFEFPKYYGRNLDALFDCLTDLSETEVIIKLDGVSEEGFRDIIEVFQDASAENQSLKVSIV